MYVPNCRVICHSYPSIIWFQCSTFSSIMQCVRLSFVEIFPVIPIPLLCYINHFQNTEYGTCCKNSTVYSSLAYRSPQKPLEGTGGHKDEALKWGPSEQYKFLNVQVRTGRKKKASNSIQLTSFSTLAIKTTHDFCDWRSAVLGSSDCLCTHSGAELGNAGVWVPQSQNHRVEVTLLVDVYKIIAVLENISQSLCFLWNKRDSILFTPYGSIFVFGW